MLWHHLNVYTVITSMAWNIPVLLLFYTLTKIDNSTIQRKWILMMEFNLSALVLRLLI